MNQQLTNDQLKTMIFEYLRNNPETQFENILQFGIQSKIGRPVSTPESQMVLELLHELEVSNILMPAMNRANAGWPWFSLTSHGKQMLSGGGPPVYDYDGFLADLKARVPKCDVVILRYVSESLRAFQYNMFFASMVMLGCASEKAIVLLIDAYVSSIDKPTNQAKLRSRIANRDISTAFDEFKKSFDTTKNQVPLSQVIKDFDAHVDAIFTFIRLLRNSIVHPTAMPHVTSALAYANLQQFTYYVDTIFKLITYYESNKITV